MTHKVMTKILITTVPFGEKSQKPIDLLQAANIDFVINPLGRKLREEELAEMIGQFDGLIAGTEIISSKVLQKAPRLKLISRVGVGLDGVDLLDARSRGIVVSYTPDAPVLAVADLTIGLMFNLLRGIHIANSQMHRGHWARHFGCRIQDATVGIIGAGRIGKQVISFLDALGVKKILVNDINPGLAINSVEKEFIYKESDIISLHVPLSAQTRNMIKKDQLLLMRPDAMLINTARGGVINERDLVDVLRLGHLGAVAMDVFEQEPYSGELSNIERCLLTSHMGSMSVDCRTQMEVEATEEVIRFFSKAPLQGVVPEDEYESRRLN